MGNRWRLAATAGLSAALVAGIFLGGWSSHGGSRAERVRETLKRMPKEPDILINLEAPDVPGTPDLTRLGRAGAPALRAGLLGNVQDELRERFAVVLAALRDPASQTDLVHALGDRSPGVRAAALRGLGLLVSTEPVPAIIALVGDPEQPDYIKETALETLGRLGDKRAIRTLVEQLDQEHDWSRKRAALRALWRMRNTVPRGTLESELRGVLSEVDDGVAADIVRWLGKMRSTRSVDELVATFPGASRSLKNRIIIALGDIGDDDAEEFLLGYLRRSQDGRLLNNAAIALGKIGSRAAAVRELTRLMADPKAYIRVNAAFALGELGAGEALTALEKGLADKNDYVRSESAVALGRIGDPRAVPLLERHARDANPFVRLDVVIALNRIDYERFGKLLREDLLKSKHERVRTRALQFLADKRDPTVTPHVIELLRSAPTERRAAAVEALANMPSVDAADLVPALLYPLLTERWSTDLQRAIHRAVREHGIHETAGLMVELAHREYGQNLRRVLFTLAQLKQPGILKRLPTLEARRNRTDQLYLAYARSLHGDAKAGDVLMAGLTDGTIGQKRDAAFLLGHVDAPAFVERLRTLLDDPDPMVGLGAAHALMARDFGGMSERIYDTLGARAPLLADEAARILTMARDERLDGWLRARVEHERRWTVRQRIADILYEREDKQFR